MDDYSKEISDLAAQIDELEQEEDADRTELADLKIQLEILKALYARARELFATGESDPELRSALAMRGYGPWGFDNVYAFVYEQAVELPGTHAAFVGGIRDTDFAALLHQTA